MQFSSNTGRSMLRELRINQIMLCTHSQCNFRCTFCPYPVHKENHQMHPDVVYKLIDTIGKYPEIEKVYLIDANEPLIDPNTFDYTQALQTKGKMVTLATNGLLLSRQKLRNSLKKIMPDELVISVQTFTNEDFERTRRVKVKFDQYLKNIVDCIAEIYPYLDNGKFIRIEVAIHPAHRLRNRILGLSIGETSFYPNVDDLCSGVAHFLELLNGHISFQKPVVEKVVLHNIRLARQGKGHINQVPVINGLFINLKTFEDWLNYWHNKRNFFARCHPEHLVIRANGDLTRCCWDYKAETKMGNVFETPFQDIVERHFDILSKSLTGNPHYDVCLRCQGQPTYRGTLIANVFSGLRKFRPKRG